MVVYILVGGLGDALGDENTDGALDVSVTVKKGFSRLRQPFIPRGARCFV